MIRQLAYNNDKYTLVQLGRGYLITNMEIRRGKYY